jgi:predicted tellurium resistance membrane protein TerC
MPAAVAALVWNLMGCAAYLADVMLSPDDIAAMSAAQQAAYAARPGWAVAATAIAVWGGAAGSLGLILRKRWAAPVLLASVLGLVAQDLALFVLTEAGSLAGPTPMILQALVFVIAVALVVLSRRATSEGWIE